MNLFMNIRPAGIALGLLLISFLSISHNITAQHTLPPEAEIFTIVEEPPYYPGGAQGALQAIADRISYPEEAIQNGISGIVYVEFVVTDEGKIANERVVRGLGYGCDEEALKAVRTLTEFQAGRQRNVPVHVQVTLPIRFNLQNANTTALSPSAMEPDPETELPDSLFTIVSKQPRPPGGSRGWAAYLASNLRYPEAALQQGLEGHVYVQFTVQPDGNIENVKAVKGIGGGCDEEAERVVRNSPNWAPAEQYGKAVKTNLAIPIVFSLGQDSQLPRQVQLAKQKVDPIEKQTRIRPANPSYASTLQAPTYKGYDRKFLKDMIKHLAYPEEARAKGITGEVSIAFTIDKKGNMVNLSIPDSAGHGFDEAAMNLAENMGGWIPARNSEVKRVPINMILTVVFNPHVYPFGQSADQDNLATEDSETSDNNPEYDTKPSHIGGLKAFSIFLQNNLKYPTEAKRKGIEGRVFVTYTVDKEGNIKNVEVAKGIGGGCDEEAIRLFEKLGKMNPGMKDGQPIEVTMVATILFKLSDDRKR